MGQIKILNLLKKGTRRVSKYEKENGLHKYKTTKSLLSKKVDENNIFLKKLKKLYSSRHRWFMLNQEINKATARTLTATMVKCIGRSR